jgi:hypothetical protein
VREERSLECSKLLQEIKRVRAGLQYILQAWGGNGGRTACT